MGPGIGRSIAKGFAAASKSWPGIGFFAGGWILVMLVTVGAVAVTRIPEELLRPPSAGVAPAPAAKTPAATAPTGTTEAATKGTDLFNQMSKAADTAALDDEGDVSSTAPAAGNEDLARRERIALEWLGRAWPMLLLCLIFLIAANLWLTGGQIGYLAKRVITQQAPLSEFWTAGTRAFSALLGGWGLSLLAVGALALIVALIALLFYGLSHVTPDWLLVLLGIALGVAAVVGAIWLSVRVAFWFIAILMEKVGPIAGLKISFRATRGQWWKLFGLQALLVLIAIGVGLVFRLLDAAGGAIGGAGMVVGVISAVLGTVANIYLGFVMTAANIQFYQDAKSLPARPALAGA